MEDHLDAPAPKPPIPPEPPRAQAGLRRRLPVVLAAGVAVVAAAIGFVILRSPPAPTFSPGPTDSQPPTLTGLYGSAIGADTKANLQVGWTDGVRVAHRFLANTTSRITGVRFAQRGGQTYSGGTGGTMRITIQTDAAGFPSGAVLGSATYQPGNPGGAWAKFDAVPISAPVTMGQRYHVVFEDVGPDPADNYISVNELFVYGPTVIPRQPAFTDADYAVLSAKAGTWKVADNYTADMDVSYADGTHDGMAYIQNMIEYYGTISGASAVREHFTLSGGARSVSSASVRVRRANGGDPLVISLLQGDTVLARGSVAAADIAQSEAGGDTGGSVWAPITFPAVTLADKTTYDLVLTTAPTSTYTAAPLREGTDVGLLSWAFRDGSGQRSSNGSNWSNLFEKSPVDLQFYFR